MQNSAGTETDSRQVRRKLRRSHHAGRTGSPVVHGKLRDSWHVRECHRCSCLLAPVPVIPAVTPSQSILTRWVVRLLVNFTTASSKSTAATSSSHLARHREGPVREGRSSSPRHNPRSCLSRHFPASKVLSCGAPLKSFNVFTLADGA